MVAASAGHFEIQSLTARCCQALSARLNVLLKDEFSYQGIALAMPQEV